MAQQLPLGLELRPRVDFGSFIGTQNAELVSRLRLTPDPFLYLWGESGSGKSHLLQASCRETDERGESSAYIPLEQIDELEPGVLEGLEGMQLVCLDDLQQLAGKADWELALFNLFNRLRENSAQLVVSANAPPAQLPILLADLASRLTWGPCYHLLPLDDAGRVELLIRQAEQRGLKLSSEIAIFLIQRLPRDSHSLTRLVERLDHASLAEKHRLTIPFVRRVLQL